MYTLKGVLSCIHGYIVLYKGVHGRYKRVYKSDRTGRNPGMTRLVRLSSAGVWRYCVFFLVQTFRQRMRKYSGSSIPRLPKGNIHTYLHACLHKLYFIPNFRITTRANIFETLHLQLKYKAYTGSIQVHI